MYRIFDILLDSDIPLPELPESEIAGDELIISVRKGGEKKSYANDINWLHDWQDNDDEIFLACGRVENGTLLRFIDLVDFIVSPQLDAIEYYQEATTPADSLRHLLLDQVVPRTLGQRGELVLHASAVILEKNTGIVFVGDSGWGKSTLASSFHQAGKPLITDDCLLLNIRSGEVFGIPNYYGVRLFQDSAESIFKGYESTTVAHYIDKKRLTLKEQNVPDFLKGVKLKAVVLLGDPEKKPQSKDINIQKIIGADEMVSLIEQIFILDVSDKEMVRKFFKKIGEISKLKLPVYRIDYPRDYEKLPEICKMIETSLS